MLDGWKNYLPIAAIPGGDAAAIFLAVWGEMWGQPIIMEYYSILPYGWCKYLAD
jgi:hypothetical protein